MFFIGIFGIETKEKLIKILEGINCKHCTSNRRGKLIKIYTFFHFFFIPIFKWNEKYYITCENCNAVYEIPKEKGKAMEKGEKVEIVNSDIVDLNAKYSKYGAMNVCPNCKKVLDKNYKYCPHCGEKISD